MSNYSALTEALNELNKKPAKPQVTKKKINESKTLKEAVDFTSQIPSIVKEVMSLAKEHDFQITESEVKDALTKVSGLRKYGNFYIEKRKVYFMDDDYGFLSFLRQNDIPDEEFINIDLGELYLEIFKSGAIFLNHRPLDKEIEYLKKSRSKEELSDDNYGWDDVPLVKKFKDANPLFATLTYQYSPKGVLVIDKERNIKFFIDSYQISVFEKGTQKVLYDTEKRYDSDENVMGMELLGNYPAWDWKLIDDGSTYGEYVVTNKPVTTKLKNKELPNAQDIPDEVLKNPSLVVDTSMLYKGSEYSRKERCRKIIKELFDEYKIVFKYTDTDYDRGEDYEGSWANPIYIYESEKYILEIEFSGYYKDNVTVRLRKKEENESLKVNESKEIKEDNENVDSTVLNKIDQEDKEFMDQILANIENADESLAEDYENVARNYDYIVITVTSYTQTHYYKNDMLKQEGDTKIETVLREVFKLEHNKKIAKEALKFFKTLCKKYKVEFYQSSDFRVNNGIQKSKELKKLKKAKDPTLKLPITYYQISMYMGKNGKDPVPCRLRDLEEEYESVNESKEIKENFYDDAEEICDIILDAYYRCVDYVNQHKDNPFPESRKGFLNNYLNKIRDVIFNGKNESVNEDYMHKDYHIKEIDNDGEFWWEDDDKILYYVPELGIKFTSKKDAIDAIDAVVKYEKEHKDDKLRKEIMLAYAERDRKLKDINDKINAIIKDILEKRNSFKSLEPVTEDEVRELVSDVIKNNSSIFEAVNSEKIFGDVVDLNGEEDKEPDQQKVLDFYNGTYNLVREIEKLSKSKALMAKPAHFLLVKGYVSNGDGLSDLLYDDNLEKREFPYYVVVYDGGAAYEPAEGGYYVDTMTATYSKGFKVLSDARKYAKKLADEEGLPKINDDIYSHTGKYVGDSKEIVVEKSDEYLQRTSKYHGYS